jgi:hypothetical protein
LGIVTAVVGIPVGADKLPPTVGAVFGTLNGAVELLVPVALGVVVVEACPEAGKLPALDITGVFVPFEFDVGAAFGLTVWFVPVVDVVDDPENGFAVGVEKG